MQTHIDHFKILILIFLGQKSDAKNYFQIFLIFSRNKKHKKEILIEKNRKRQILNMCKSL